MKNHLLTLILMVFLFDVSAQTVITGKILEKDTSEPIPGVNIYLANSQIGTVSEVDGTFSLSVPVAGKVNLFFSHIGYKSTERTVYTTSDRPVNVLLEINETQLTEVEVNAKSDKVWQRKLKRFRTQFLGNDKFAKYCKILNPWDIDFTENKGGFVAVSNQVLKIENKATGFLVNYYLRDFRIESNITFYSGLASFEPLEPESLEQYAEWEKNRREAYNGSLRHFLKSAQEEELDEDGFEAHLVKLEKGDYADRITDLSRNFEQRATKQMLFSNISKKRHLKFSRTLRIRYYDADARVKEQESFVRLVAPVPIDEYGNLEDISGIVTYGTLAAEGFPYLLPLNYVGDQQKNDLARFGNAVVRPFTKYNTNHPVEKLHIHTDKDLYLDSETIWFKGYVTMNDQPGKLSTKLFVQLIQEDKTYIKAVIPVENGIAYGSMKLDKKMPVGDYILKAYTSWTDSLEDRHHFHKRLQVGLTDGKAPGKTTSVSNYLLKAFPEGGHLVDNVVNNVAFEVVTEKNQFVNVELALMDDQNKQLQTFFPDWQGKGTFQFKPDDKKTYRLVVKDDPEISVPLETTDELNVAMQMYRESKLIKLELNSSTKIEKPVHLLITSGGKVVYFASVALAKKEVIDLDPSLLADGVNQVTLFDYEYQPLAERLYFNAPKQAAGLSVAVDRAVQGKRSKAAVTISGDDSIRSASIAVISNNVSYASDENSILYSTYLKPHITGSITGLTDGLSDTEQARKELDLLMLVNGWRQYDWERIKEVKTTVPQTLILQNGFDIKGALTNKLNSKPYGNVSLFLMVNDSLAGIRSAVTDEAGRFVFEDVVFRDSTELVFKVVDKVKGSYQLQYTFDPVWWNDQMAYEYYTASTGSTADNPAVSLDKDEMIRLTNFDGKTYYLDDAVIVGQKEQELLAIPRIYSFPDSRDRIVLDSLPPGSKTTTFNLINQNFPFVRAFSYYLSEPDSSLNSTGQVGLFRTVSLTTNQNLWANPGAMAILVDNYLVDVDYLYGMNPLEIETLEILRGPKAAILGANSAAGAVVIYTKRNRGTPLEKLPNFYKTRLKGYQNYKEFYSPDYEEFPDPSPDNRTTLYWNPLVDDQDRVIEYYNGDITGKFQVIVEGFTREGKPFRTTDFYEVGASQ